MPKQASKRNQSRHRRPAPARPPCAPDLPPDVRQALPPGLPSEAAARAALAASQIFLRQNRLRSAERWLTIAGRLVSIGQQIDRAETEANRRPPRRLDDVWARLAVDRTKS